MKGLIFLGLITVSFISCLKSDNRDLGTDYSGDGYLLYELNNKPYEYTGGIKRVATNSVGVYVKKTLKSATTTSTQYTITGQIGLNKTINIVIVTDSLKTGGYTTSTYSSGITSAKIDTVVYANYRPADLLSINISRYAGGIIEGTFSGKLSLKSSSGTTTYTDGVITNGVFKNLQVQYP